MEHLGASCITARTSVTHVLLSTLVGAFSAAGIDARLLGDDTEVCGITRAAGEVLADDLYVCDAGDAAASDLRLAIGRGAAACLCADGLAWSEAAARGLSAIVVDDVPRAEARAAALLRRDGPSDDRREAAAG